MTSLSCSSEFVSVTCGNNTFIIRLHDNDLTSINHASIAVKIPHNPQIDASLTTDNKQNRCLRSSQPDNEDLGLGLLSSDISLRGNLLAFCTYTKYLCIVKLNQQKPVLSKIYHLARGASKIKFTPKTENIVVADKSGDVHLFRINEESNTSQLVLGHLSLLLDVLVTSDEQVIITCDRDEKIRVSCFPNGYNIIAYCLGHQEFVSSLGFLSHETSYIFSTSGDGTILFWDFIKGRELMACNVLSHIRNERSCNINDSDVAAITDSESILVNESTSLICICIENLNMFMTLKCFSEGEKLQYSICQYIPFGNLSPWRTTISTNSLWIALNSNEKSLVKSFMFNSETCCFEEAGMDTQPAGACKLLNNQNMYTDFKKNIVDLLFKKKFDNVLEYLRKKDEKCMSLSSEPTNKRIKH